MELLPYQSLRDLVRKEGPLTPAQAARVGLGVLAALRAAHAEGVLHRDVKPANILVGPDGRVVLTDFGIARAIDSPTLTTGGALVGSPSYIAPERARGGQSSPAGDLWGLGASLYAAVEGHRRSSGTPRSRLSPPWSSTSPKKPSTRDRYGRSSVPCSARIRTSGSTRPRPSDCSARSLIRTRRHVSCLLPGVSDRLLGVSESASRRVPPVPQSAAAPEPVAEGLRYGVAGRGAWPRSRVAEPAAADSAAAVALAPAAEGAAVAPPEPDMIAPPSLSRYSVPVRSKRPSPHRRRCRHRVSRPPPPILSRSAPLAAPAGLAVRPSRWPR